MPASNKDGVSYVVKHFDNLPGSARISVSDLSVLSHRSKPTIYRDVKKGKLTLKKNGAGSTTSKEEALCYMGGEA